MADRPARTGFPEQALARDGAAFRPQQDGDPTGQPPAAGPVLVLDLLDFDPILDSPFSDRVQRQIWLNTKLAAAGLDTVPPAVEAVAHFPRLAPTVCVESRGTEYRFSRAIPDA